ncbi:hypothetical protein GCM10022226_06590 [Sphaerisporangium flaviroseum]|uniref:Uncharacterized protein n=2 Tax=Sphaerisporangium flaviroseum TaxID=509199 RepID=A0ABP7HF91_9ACTN
MNVDPDMEDWLERLTREGIAPPLNNSRKMGILHSIFHEHGPVGTDEAAEILLDAMGRAVEALVTVSKDMSPHTRAMARITVGLDSGFPYLKYVDGWRHGDDLVFDSGDAGTLAQVADTVQEFLMEREHHVWPVCTAHHVGLHSQISGADAVWYCKTGGHVWRIGRLLTDQPDP